MKHLIILISLLLLSSPVIGDEPVVLYLWKTSSGLVWKGFGDKETQPVYKGEVENGVPNGLGIMIYPTYGVGSERGVKYVGNWDEGRFWYGWKYDKYGNIVGKLVSGEWIK